MIWRTFLTNHDSCSPHCETHFGCKAEVIQIHMAEGTVWLGAADIFLEIVMQPFLGFDDIVPDSSSPATV